MTDRNVPMVAERCPCCGHTKLVEAPDPVLVYEVEADGVARWHPSRRLSTAELIAILSDPSLDGVSND